jgi:Ca2+-binding RTX toxin-like protein
MRTVHALSVTLCAGAFVVAGLSAPASTAQAVDASTCFGKVPTIVGTDGDDVIVGTEGDDVIAGHDGTDDIRGLGGDDLICAGANADVGSTTVRFETVSGGPGDDRIDGGPGLDRLFGDGGHDRIEGGSAPPAVSKSLSDGSVWSFYAQALEGGSGRDLIVGSASTDIVLAGSGRDTVVSGGGDDYVFGQSGRDLARAGSGDDRVRDRPVTGRNYVPSAPASVTNTVGTDVVGDAPTADFTRAEIHGKRSNERFRGGSGDDHIVGSSGRDVVRGGSGDDDVDGANGNDEVRGGPGNDRLRPDDGADTVFGGDGVDVVSYAFNRSSEGRTAGRRDRVTVDLRERVVTGAQGRDRLRSIQGAEGSQWGRDVLLGSSGGDLFLNPFGQVDGRHTGRIDGRGGRDTFRLEWTAAQWMRIDLARGTLSIANVTDAACDAVDAPRSVGRFRSLENVTYALGPNGLGATRMGPCAVIDGSSAANVLSGTTEFPSGTEDTTLDVINGHGGNDVIVGRDGDDVLDGGAGTNRIDGGPGVDTCTRPDTAGGALNCEN